MINDFNFMPFDPAHADILAKDGEIFVPYNLTDYGDGVYRNAPEAVSVATLPDGYHGIAMHHTGCGTNIIVGDQTGSIYLINGDTSVPEYIAHTGEIIDARACGGILAIAAKDRLLYLRAAGDGYSVLDGVPQMPVIEFGLQRAGSLACSDRIAVASDQAAQAIGYGETGSSASRVHPSASGIRDEAEDISAAVLGMYNDAVRSQCTAKGYVDRPFFIRYALRLHDGSYVMASPPVLMLPTVLPPRIAVQESGSDMLTVDLTAIHYFQIRMRILSGASEPWRGIITAVDIFVSQPVDTYDTTGASLGYITDFGTIANQTDSGGFVRGRHYPSQGSRSGSEVFDGHYSLGNDIYTDHYIDTNLARKAWHLAPNPRLQDQLTSTGEFFRIASIPYSALSAAPDFVPVPLLTADFYCLKQHRALPSDICILGTAIAPSAIKVYGDQLVVASSASCPYPAMPLRSMAAYYGKATDTGDDIQIDIYSRRMGYTHVSSCRCQGMGVALAEAFPRYLYCPDPEAYMMAFTQGTETRCISLTPHESMPGSYWWGGLSDNYIPEVQGASAMPDCCHTTICDTRIYTSLPDNPLCLMPRPLMLGDTEVWAMHSALQAPKLGSFGLYPLYAFTSGGIWLLSYSDSNRSLASAKMISADVPHGRRSIADANDSVAFISGTRLMTVQGSTVQCLSRIAGGLRFDVRRLPHYGTLLDAADAQLTDEDAVGLLSGTALIYSPEAEMLVLGNPERDYALLFSLRAGAWSIINAEVKYPLLCGAEGLWTDASGGIVRLGDTPGVGKGLLVTRPLKCGAPAVPHDVESVEVMGDFTSAHICTAVYGTDNISHWHLVGSSSDRRTADHSRCRYRYLCVAAVTGLDADEYVSGIQICQ